MVCCVFIKKAVLMKVKQMNFWCTQSKSPTFSFVAPCAPVGVEVSRDCAGNRATVSWQSLQAGGLYTAVLQGEHGLTVNCSTSFNNCTTADLLCGVNYNVTVSRNDAHCRSLPSTPIQIQSGNSLPSIHTFSNSNRSLTLTMYLL